MMYSLSNQATVAALREVSKEGKLTSFVVEAYLPILVWLRTSNVIGKTFDFNKLRPVLTKRRLGFFGHLGLLCPLRLLGFYSAEVLSGFTFRHQVQSRHLLLCMVALEETRMFPHTQFCRAETQLRS